MAMNGKKKGLFFLFLYVASDPGSSTDGPNITLFGAPICPVYLCCFRWGNPKSPERRMRVEISPVEEEEETASSLFVVCLSIQWGEKTIEEEGTNTNFVHRNGRCAVRILFHMDENGDKTFFLLFKFVLGRFSFLK